MQAMRVKNIVAIEKNIKKVRETVSIENILIIRTVNSMEIKTVILSRVKC